MPLWRPGPLRLKPGTMGNPAHEPLLNLALLLAADRVGDMRTGVDKLATEHSRKELHLEVSGPWPPYSFCPMLAEEG